MQVHREINRLPEFRNAVITIGTFDGVHKGHQQIIEALQRTAAEMDGESVLITFHPHPRKIVQPDSSLELINSLEERIKLLSDHHIGHLVVVPFTEAFAAQDPHDYIKNFLIKLFHPRAIIIGYDHHFGKDRQGGFDLLADHAKKYDYKLIEIPRHVLNEIAVSSTKIRKAIRESNTAVANELLGYPFFFHGKVVHGEKLGRTLGYPTANLKYIDTDKIHAGEGVYAAMAEVGGI
jgi:riboflavin kinase / FMN adenylyltransferase